MSRLDYSTATPGGMDALGRVYDHVLASGLPRALVALIGLRVAQINGSAHCIDIHARELVSHGFATGKLVLTSAWREGGMLFSRTERGALAWAETVTRVRETGIKEPEYQAAASVFPASALADLTIAIGLMNTYNRLAIAFRRLPEALAGAADLHPTETTG